MYRRVSEQGKYWDNFALLVKWANMSDEISPISGRLYPKVSLDPTISELVTLSGFYTKCICNQCVCCSEQVLCKWILQWWSAFLQKWQFAILVKFSSMQFNCCLMMKPNSRTNFYIISASSMGFIFDWQRMKESWQRGRILDWRKYLCSEWKWVCIAGQWGGYQLYWLEWAIAAYKGQAHPIPNPMHPGGLTHTHIQPCRKIHSGDLAHIQPYSHVQFS